MARHISKYRCKDFWDAVCEMCAYVGVDKEGEA